LSEAQGVPGLTLKSNVRHRSGSRLAWPWIDAGSGHEHALLARLGRAGLPDVVS